MKMSSHPFQRSTLWFYAVITLIASCTFNSCDTLAPDDWLPQYPGVVDVDSTVLYLGDVFDRVNEFGELEWDGNPVPGAAFKLLMVSDGVFDYSGASASLAPLSAPFGSARLIKSSIGRFREELNTEHRFLELFLPDDLAPGFYWLAVEVGDHSFGPIRIEIANPELQEARGEAFQLAEQTLAELQPETPYLLTGLMNPVSGMELQGIIPQEEVPLGAWPIFASRRDEKGGIVLAADQPSELLLLVDINTQEVSTYKQFGLANWTLYNYPAAPPRGGYNGWWWKQPNLPAGGTCGTAWCNYPYPGNRIRTISNRLSIITEPIDPNRWWSGTGGGWVCGNGWFYGRRGQGGYRMGPWWPLDTSGKPKPGLGGPMPTEPEEETPTTPPPPSTPRRPPGLQPPPELPACTANYVEAVSKYTYGKPPFGQRTQRARLGGQHAIYTNLPDYTGQLRWARFPTNWTRRGGYEYAWSTQEAQAELTRNRGWWNNYCIALADEQITLRNSRRLRRFARRYKAWLDQLPQGANPDVVMGLGDDLTNEGVALYELARKHYAKAAGKRRLRGAIHVFFMPRVVARIGNEANRSRPTETSFTDPDFPFVALNQLDSDDPYILAHELIHALGRPSGELTWDHESGDPRAMSRITRRTVRQPAGLSAGRLLDYAEYQEILRSGNLKPVGGR